MSGAVYSGDDIGAVVLDVGSNTMRVGYAGEEYPRHDIPSSIAIYEENYLKKYNIGTVALHSKHPGAEITTFLKDGMVENWDHFENMLEYIFTKRLHTAFENHPVLLTEPAWVVQHKREQMVELMFEKFNSPAVHLAKGAMLVGMSNSRPTTLIVDSGATHTTAVPIHEGFVVSQAIVKSPAGSDYILEQARMMLQDRKVDLVPYYRVASKEVVKQEEAPIWREKHFKGVTASWHNYMVKEVMQDFHASVLQLSESTYDEDVVRTSPTVHYEFPNGYNRDFGIERFKVVEPLFNLTARVGNGIQPSLDVSSLVTTSVGMCEMDIRATMYSNVIITGGNSNIHGFTERLTRDLQLKVPPSMRLKIIPQNGSIDRRFAPWLGGAILGSLATFQSYWISKQEYEEVGKVIVHSRC
ncbi:PREDICTED: actin-like protein 6B isoform X2 [Nicrophorus vespilloides]|uniref:Actin-like protein 6B isoform X2 n=1 Tax=Nicrophorus vespilloides TaxID=110193 RepID=A0ABM1N089_NICVS|nr:PREDICTED: actin-like protein 6B isoform X2 [Nicrophorus vespilloides]